MGVFYADETESAVGHAGVIDNQAKLTITNGGYNSWSMGFYQTNLIIKQDVTYQVNFSAWTDSSKSQRVKSLVQMNDDPWIRYSDIKYLNISNEINHYSYTFKMDHPTDMHGTLTFQFGGPSADGNIYIDDVELLIIEDNDYNYQSNMPTGLYRGINFGNALDAPSEGEWGWTIQENYFDIVENAGFDHIRIPIRWSSHAEYEPPYSIDPAFFDRIDWVVNNTISKGMTAVIDFHHYHELFGSETEDSPIYSDMIPLSLTEHKDRFLELWRQIAEHYKDYPDNVYFEIMNEPNSYLTPSRWNEYVQEAITIIRETNPARYIIIDTACWGKLKLNPDEAQLYGEYGALDNLVIPENDDKLIVSFHYYVPFDFCFQGAGWFNSPPIGTPWYGTDDDLQQVREAFDYAVEWSKAHNNVPLWNGEYGVHHWADYESRVRWTSFVTREAEKRGIANAVWSFHFADSAGLYNSLTDEWKEELVKALIP